LPIFILLLSNYIEHKTGFSTAFPPDVPYFETKSLPTQNSLADFRVSWIPNFKNGKPGSHFLVKYRLKSDSNWWHTEPELDNDYIDIRGLDPDEQYEFKVVAVNGGFWTESKSQFISAFGID
jgi:neuronal cell adhesion protein